MGEWVSSQSRLNPADIHGLGHYLYKTTVDAERRRLVVNTETFAQAIQQRPWIVTALRTPLRDHISINPIIRDFDKNTLIDLIDAAAKEAARFSAHLLDEENSSPKQKRPNVQSKKEIAEASSWDRRLDALNRLASKGIDAILEDHIFYVDSWDYINFFVKRKTIPETPTTQPIPQTPRQRRTQTKIPS